MSRDLLAYDYLRRRHNLTDVQAAGLVGTFVQESQMDTGARNRGDGRDGSDSIGIGQWNQDRAEGLKAFAADRGVDWNNLEIQLDYAMEELNGREGRAGAMLANAQTVEDAARAAISFERPSGFSWDAPEAGHGWENRLNNARWLAGMSGESASAPAAPPPMTGGMLAGLDGGAGDAQMMGGIGADFLTPFAVSGATRPDSFTGMKDEFSGALANMIQSAPPEIQDSLRVSSGYRSPERQAQLYQEALAKYGSEAEARRWVAPPGNSQHNHGNAADLKFLSPAAKEWVHRNASQFGLSFPLNNEDWHIELAGARGGDGHNHGTAPSRPTGSASAGGMLAFPSPAGGSMIDEDALAGMLAGFDPSAMRSQGNGADVLSGGTGDDTLGTAGGSAIAWDDETAGQLMEDGGGIIEWEDAPLSSQAPVNDRAMTLDSRLRVPAMVRAEVGALEKPEDKLAALRKFYPDAAPYIQTDAKTGERTDSGNFVMTDPQTGSAMLYNPVGLDMGDFASLIPEAGEFIGGTLGAIGGGAAGATAGSALPVLGTAAGGVTGAIAGAGTGGLAGRELAQRGANWLFGNQDTRTTGEQLTDAAWTLATNMVGEGVGQAIGAGVRGAMRSKSGASQLSGDALDEGRRVVEDFQAAGLTPTAGMVSKRSALPTTEQIFMAEGGQAGKALQARVDAAYDGVSQGVQNVAARMSPGGQPLRGKQEIGAALRQQAEQVQADWAARNSSLHDEAGRLAAGQQASGTAVQNVLDALINERAAMGASATRNRGPLIDDVIERAEDVMADVAAGADYATLKQARSDLGVVLGDRNLDRRARPYVARLYEALTSDLEGTARAAGDEALQAHRKANNFTRRGQNEASPTNVRQGLAPIIDAKTDEAVLGMLQKGVKDGGSRLAAMRRQFVSHNGQQAWEEFGSSVVARLGYSTENAAEEFSTTTFLKNWSQVSDEAKNVLFRGTGRAQYRMDLDRFARIAEDLKGFKRSDNHSNTAKWSNRNKALALIGGGGGIGAGVGALAGTGAGLGAAAAAGAVFGGAAAVNATFRRAIGDMLADPATLNWMVGLPRNIQMGPRSTRDAMAKLRTLGTETARPATRQAIATYLQTWQEMEEEEARKVRPRTR